MRKIILKYRVSKYRRITRGLLFAVISFAALSLCIFYSLDNASSELKIFLPFIIAIISMFLGFLSMFYHYSASPSKI
jgi:hypothetical protein